MVRRRSGGVLAGRVTDVDRTRGDAVGARVGFTFRRLFTAGDVHDYFWKAVLVDGE